jgi:hypothetical protein
MRPAPIEDPLGAIIDERDHQPVVVVARKLVIPKPAMQDLESWKLRRFPALWRTACAVIRFHCHLLSVSTSKSVRKSTIRSAIDASLTRGSFDDAFSAASGLPFAAMTRTLSAPLTSFRPRAEALLGEAA